MCYGTCPNENRDGECTGRPYSMCPGEEGYQEAKDRSEYERDCADEQRMEERRERQAEDWP